MRLISKQRFIPADVLVRFEDGTVSLSVPLGATLADITESLDSIGKWHKGQPLSIDVRFKTWESARAGPSLHPMISFPVSQRKRAPGVQSDKANRAAFVGSLLSAKAVH